MNVFIYIFEVDGMKVLVKKRRDASKNYLLVEVSPGLWFTMLKLKEYPDLYQRVWDAYKDTLEATK